MIDIYVLDDNFKRVAVIDVYESLIWTERYNEVGDFEILIPKSSMSRVDIEEDDYLNIDDSFRIMVVRSVDTSDTEDGDFIKVTGYEVADILKERVLKESLATRSPASAPSTASGEGVISSVLTWQLGSSTEDVPTGSWVSSRPTPGENQFLWSRVLTEFGNGATKASYRVIYTDFAPHEDSSSTLAYSVSDSQNTPTSSTWYKGVPTVPSGKWLWSKNIVKYSGGGTRTTYDVAKFSTHNNGYADPVTPGRYIHVAFATNPSGSNGFSRTRTNGRNYFGVYADNTLASSDNYTAYTWKRIGSSAEAEWILTDTPRALVTLFFKHICIDGALSLSDRLSPLTSTSPFANSTNPYPDDEVEVTVSAHVLYDVIKELCDMYDLGFRMGFNYDTQGFFFECYSGNDRTSSQSTHPAVIFSPQMNTVTETTEYISTLDYRNYAYVNSNTGMRIRKDQNVANAPSGFKRRVVLVDALDIPEGEPDVNTTMDRYGDLELAKHRSTHALDGAVSETVLPYYEVGDIVELRSESGLTNKMRVSERIIVSDLEGKRSYPTLTTKEFVMPGSWTSWEWNISWDDAEGTWDSIG